MEIKPSEVMSVLSKHMLVDGYDFVVDLRNSCGNYLVEARSGDRYLDFFTFFASNPLDLTIPKCVCRMFSQSLH